jgi:hypothetical protein
MRYQSYGNRKSTPSRKTRKGMRNTVFVANKKMAKAQRKAARLERKSLREEQAGE